MNKPTILAVGGGRTYGKSYLMALYAREKVADDMYKSSKNDKKKNFINMNWKILEQK